jgi:putative two-component system response regulator
MQKTIFVVDDNDTNLSMAEEALEDQYRVMTLPSASKMFALLEKITPDLILLDIEMPEMNGFDALRRLKTNSSYAGIPVIFLTSMNDAATEVHGFQLGVVDFISKPFSAPVLLNRIRTHLSIDEIIRERTAQIQKLQNGIIFVFADMVENRDDNTGGHVERTEYYIRILVEAMVKRGVYADTIRDMDMELLSLSARLHDVGKIAIPDRVLNKPGKLDDDEWMIMKTHANEGEHVIDAMVARTDNVEFLRHAKLFAGYHHERWDGTGYPYGLKDTKIPIQGRIMAIADVYDALVSSRPYKNALSDDEAFEIVKEGAGKHFDPYIIDVFLELQNEFREIKLKYPD